VIRRLLLPFGAIALLGLLAAHRAPRAASSLRTVLRWGLPVDMDNLRAASEAAHRNALEAARSAVAGEPSLPLRWFNESGHFIYSDEPRRFAAAVVEFIEDAPAVRRD
jgi:hypothetical protein